MAETVCGPNHENVPRGITQSMDDNQDARILQGGLGGDGFFAPDEECVDSRDLLE